MVRLAERIPLLLMAVLLGFSSLACNMTFSSGTQSEPLESAPRVFFTAPVNRLIDSAIPEYAEGSLVAFRAVAQDSEVGVQRIVFSVDERVIGEVVSQQSGGERYLTGEATWTAASPKGYGITVEAYRADGTRIGADQRSIRVADRSVTVPRPQSTTMTNTLPTATPSVATISRSSVTDVPSASDASDAGVSVRAYPVDGGPATRVNAASLNVRSGPGINYDPVGTLTQGEIIPVVGRSADGAWYAVALGSQTAWVFASLTTLQSGDAGQLPIVAVRELPSTPIPTDTAVSSPADLVISGVRLDPATPSAGMTFRVFATVVNQGGTASPEADALVTMQPGDERSPADPRIPVLQPGQSAEVFFNVTLAVSGTALTGVVEVDVYDVVAEGVDGEANNSRLVTYDVLAADGA